MCNRSGEIAWAEGSWPGVGPGQDFVLGLGQALRWRFGRSRDLLALGRVCVVRWLCP